MLTTHYIIKYGMVFTYGGSCMMAGVREGVQDMDCEGLDSFGG